MNNQVKSKITRHLFASLLNSSLTNKEIVELCDSILSGSLYIHEFASTLKNQIERSPLFGIDVLQDDEVAIEVDEVYSEIRSRRIPKDEVINRIMMYGTDFNRKYNKGNIKSILKEFLHSSNEEVWNHFKDSIISDNYFKHMGHKY